MATTATITATTTHQIKLSPSIKTKLLTALRTYVELAAQKKVIEHAQKLLRKTIEAIQVEVGESSLEIDGFKSTIVAPIRKTLDKKRFVALGGDLDILERSYVEQPGTSYVKITSPTGSNDDD